MASRQLLSSSPISSDHLEAFARLFPKLNCSLSNAINDLLNQAESATKPAHQEARKVLLEAINNDDRETDQRLLGRNEDICSVTENALRTTPPLNVAGDHSLVREARSSPRHGDCVTSRAIGIGNITPVGCQPTPLRETSENVRNRFHVLSSSPTSPGRNMHEENRSMVAQTEDHLDKASQPPPFSATFPPSPVSEMRQTPTKEITKRRFVKVGKLKLRLITEDTQESTVTDRSLETVLRPSVAGRKRKAEDEEIESSSLRRSKRIRAALKKKPLGNPSSGHSVYEWSPEQDDIIIEALNEYKHLPVRKRNAAIRERLNMEDKTARQVSNRIRTHIGKKKRKKSKVL